LRAGAPVARLAAGDGDQATLAAGARHRSHAIFRHGLPTRRALAREAMTMKGTMLWFNEVKDYGFILTEDGERLYVDRDGFVERAAPVGRCARLPVRLTVSERDGTRIAVDVSLVREEPHGRARRRRASGIRSG
jgi:hypothetical protein